MAHTFHNPASLPPPQGRYSQAVEVRPGARYLFISGQVGMTAAGIIPPSFDEQCHLIYQNILALLVAANMRPSDLVKLTVFLTDPQHVLAHGQIRREYLGDHQPASSAVVVQTLNPAWLLEVEAVAASDP
jgi:enamine deaminase RidA (YjgF/YER057c/UK114 family)